MTNNEKVIQWIEQAASKISDFAVEHIPPFIQEYLTWKFWEAAVYTCCYFVPIILMWVFYSVIIKKIWSWCKEQSNFTDGFSRLIPIVLTAVFLVITICGFPIEHIMNMIQISLAPKVYILEQASQLVKQQ
jgi:hypothetical protein